MKRLSSITAVLIITVWSAFSHEQLIFTQLSQKDGLSTTVNNIFMEDQGDAWISTPGGLFHFNGSILHKVQNSLLEGCSVTQTDMDSKGNHWIITNAGILRRDPEDGSFEKISIPDTEGTVLFYSLCHDDTGVYFGGNGRIYRYDYEDKQFHLLCDMQGRHSFTCRNICFLDERTLLCSSLNGTLMVDKETGEIDESPLASRQEIVYSMTDSKGNIWLALYNRGIKVYSRNGNLLHEFNTENSGLSNNVVLCMTEKDSIIWAGTDGGGINVINPADNTIKVLSHISGDDSSFPAHSIKSIYTDKYGNIWAGSVRDGLIRISQSGMKTFSDSHIGTTSGLSNSTVLHIYQDPLTEKIWLGTDGEGLNLFDPETFEFTHFASTLRKKVTSIASYTEDELVISIFSDGIWIFDKKTGRIRPMLIDDKDLNFQIRYSGRGITLHNEADGSLLILGNTADRYDRMTGRCQPVTRNDGNKANGNFYVIGPSESGSWIHDHKILYHLETGGTIMEEKGTYDRAGIRSGSIGPDGTIWLATDSGLVHFDTADGSFTEIETPLFDAAKSVVCDKMSRVWVGTEKRLFAYLTDSRSFAMFGESDGAALNEYLPKSHLLAKNGDIYLGGVLGLLRADSSYTIENDEEPILKLHGLKVDGKDVQVGRDLFHKISRKNNTLSINVSAYEKDMFREKMFRFYTGRGGDATETASATLSMQQMPAPGVYDIMVSCSKRNGEWSKPVRIITLDIPQPFYLTWWFLASCIVFVAGTTLAVVFSILRRKESRMQFALKEQEQKVYEEKVSMLINISHELRTPLTLIMAPLKRLINETDSSDGSLPVMNRIYRQSRRMRDLLNTVLDLRKMEVGKSYLKIESISYNDWLAHTVEDIRNEEKEAGINIVLNLDENIGDVEIDRQKCDTVVTNILMNAIKHSTAGDTITIGTRLSDDGMVRTWVSDQGPGLMDADTSRLFTRFYQSNQENYGSGIGLSYSKILVELHGGRISAGNNPDRGASFWWEIPVISPVENDSRIPSRAYLNELLGHDMPKTGADKGSHSVDMSGMSIMLVDDNQDLLDFMREALCANFSEIILTTSGNQAFRMIESGTVPDMVISDVNMADGDGFKLCNDIKSNEKFSHIPVVLLTARGEEQSQSESYRLGADGFIAKPFEIDTLLELIRSIFRRKAEIKRKYLDNDGSITSGFGSDEEGFIIRFNKVIEDNLTNPDLDQQILCRELGISRAALYNKIKAITGTGSKEYITRIRIERAKILIENGNLSFTEISEMTGFSAPSYFSTAFKNHTGYTPSGYRQKFRKENGNK